MNANDRNALTLEHVKAGYTHTQEVIRFIDTKAGALLGLAAIITFFPLYLIQWLLDHPEGMKICLSLAENWAKASYGIWVCFVAGLACGIISVWLTVDCVIPRGRGNAKATVLFPVTFDPTEVALLGRKLRQGFTPNGILDEYETQLTRSGYILGAKIRKLNRAAFWFKTEMIAYGLGCILMLTVLCNPF